MSEVDRDYSQDCNVEGNLELLHTFAITILHIVTTYLRHPFHRYRGPPSPKGKAAGKDAFATDETNLKVAANPFSGSLFS